MDEVARDIEMSKVEAERLLAEQVVWDMEVSACLFANWQLCASWQLCVGVVVLGSGSWGSAAAATWQMWRECG